METTIPNTSNNSNSEEGNLTLRKLQNHLLKALLGALVVALVGAFVTSYGFYYRANNDLDELKKSRTENIQDIKDLKKDVSEIKLALSNTGIYTNNNIEDIKGLKQDVKDVKVTINEVLKVLYEVKAKQH